ncbi:MAG: PorT family protein [Prevotella sp.]|nr:PorT family protein [Prevotella sp.]
MKKIFFIYGLALFIAPLYGQNDTAPIVDEEHFERYTVPVAATTQYSGLLKFRFGIQAGLNMSTLSGDIFGAAKQKIGFNAGLTAHYAFTEEWGIGSGLFFTTKGSNYEDAAPTKLSYLELPVYATYKVATLDAASIVLKAGPYLAYGLSAKNGDIDMYYKDEIWGTAAKRIDCGFNIGADVDFNPITVGITYELGLVNIDDTSGKIRNLNAFLSVGYNF